MANIEELMNIIGTNARVASQELSKANSIQKKRALLNAAQNLWADKNHIIAENQKDMAFGREKGLSDAMLDRLLLDESRVKAMVEGMKTIAEFPDPIGEVLEEWSQPSGISIKRVRTAIGVIGVIFESRPNVTADAAALCLMSGNAAILRGGSESFHSSTAIHAAFAKGVEEAGLPADSIQLIPTRDRAAVQKLLVMNDYVDVIVPRGGKGLVGLVQNEARVPVFAHLEGIVHMYIDKDAAPDKVVDLVLNAKTRRTGICGATECLVVHNDYQAKHGVALITSLINAGVEVRGDISFQKYDGVIAATDDDWGKEFLDKIIAVKAVESSDEAIAFIRDNHSQHTDAIITENAETAAQFFNALDSAILMWNTSTQFADGGEFGMGAEIGIATGKLHARGPVGVKQLTSFKYLVSSDGATRR